MFKLSNKITSSFTAILIIASMVNMSACDSLDYETDNQYYEDVYINPNTNIFYRIIDSDEYQAYIAIMTSEDDGDFTLFGGRSLVVNPCDNAELVYCRAGVFDIFLPREPRDLEVISSMSKLIEVSYGVSGRVFCEQTFVRVSVEGDEDTTEFGFSNERGLIYINQISKINPEHNITINLVGVSSINYFNHICSHTN